MCVCVCVSVCVGGCLCVCVKGHARLTDAFLIDSAHSSLSSNESTDKKYDPFVVTISTIDTTKYT